MPTCPPKAWRRWEPAPTRRGIHLTYGKKHLAVMTTIEPMPYFLGFFRGPTGSVARDEKRRRRTAAAAIPVDCQMNQRRGKILASLSLVAASGLPVLFLAMRWKIFTFRDDFTGFNAVGFALSLALVLLLSGTLLGGLALREDRRSWLARSALVINGVLLAGLLRLMVTLGWLS